MKVNKKNRRVLLVLVLLSLMIGETSCQSQNSTTDQLYQARDFTEAVFTVGIEGPAVDSRGMLYVVNFQEQGTIGRIEENGAALALGTSAGRLYWQRHTIWELLEPCLWLIIRAIMSS